MFSPSLPPFSSSLLAATGAWLRTLLLLSILVGPSMAGAQGRRPSMNLPVPQGIGNLSNLNAIRNESAGLLKQQNMVNSDKALEPGNLQQLRARAVKNLLRQHRDVIEADPRGEPVVRRQLLAWSPSEALLEAARADGYTVIGKRVLTGLDETLVVLGVPDKFSTEEALARLNKLDPDGTYDFNHIYTGSGLLAPRPSQVDGNTVAVPSIAMSTVTAERSPHRSTAMRVRVGLVDGGVDTAHEVFREADIRRWGCGDKPVTSAHGTAVASLMIGKADRFQGVAPGARLYAADVYCGTDIGGAADQIAQALAWLAEEKVAVINVSLVGPPNQMLERAVRAMLRRGHLLIAAVGNDGPAAPPLYPASYPGVIGVSAADAQRHVLPEAARGPQVMFVAPGSQMLAAAIGPVPYRVVRGTSFASPVVAALLAEKMEKPDLMAAKNAIDDLTQHAQRLGNAERTPDAGYGLVGESFRIAPEHLQ